jgi:hypothetical protein
MHTAVWAGSIAAPADKVWPYLRWDNLESMLPGGFFAGVEYQERRCIVGATRRVILGDGRSMREKLEAVSSPDLAYSYRIIDAADFPIAAYLGHVRLTAAGPANCSLVFACEFVPLASAEEWRATYLAMQGALAGFIRTQVE